MHLALWTACCCSFSTANTSSPQRNGLVELEEVRAERHYHSNHWQTLLYPPLILCRWWRRMCDSGFLVPTNHVQWIFSGPVTRIFDFQLHLQCSIVYISVHPAEETTEGRKSQTSLIPVALLDFHSLLFNVFVIICIPSNQWVNRSIHNKWHCGC